MCEFLKQNYCSFVEIISSDYYSFKFISLIEMKNVWIEYDAMRTISCLNDQSK